MRECIIWPKIIAVLTEKGLSQKALAGQLGVNQSTISRLAKGAGPEPRWSEGAALIELAGGVEALQTTHGIDIGAYIRIEDCSVSARLPGSVPPDPPLSLVDRRDPVRASTYTGPERRAAAGEG